ncbi:MAG TPA: DUF1345 domain-containing protein, partial [Burkholderiales bacterium]|nr:DUF1345 domain-containing protein [Burkholderiales bacterium]
MTILRQAPPWTVRFSAAIRLSLAGAAGIAVAAALAPRVVDAYARFLASWDAAVCVYLTLSWAVMRSHDARATRARVQSHDQSGYVVFLIVVACACASLVAIVWGLREMRDRGGTAEALHVVLAMLALVGSWLLINTVFAFHYARAYYRPHAGGAEHLRGLRFPGDTEPDYMDFLYYACVIGMTSQVADVAVTSRHMRRLTLV